MIADISKWITLILIIGLVVFIIKTGIKIVNVIIMILILGFSWYSFFTEEGASRLSIALTGHPLIAYTTGMERQSDLSNEDVTFFKTTKTFKVDGEYKNMTKCYTKWIIRIPSTGNNIKITK